MDVYARLDEMACFVLSELEQPLWSKGKHWFALPENQRIEQMFETAKYEFEKAVSTLDHLLGDREYVIGTQFTLADLLLAHTFNWAIRFEFDVPEKYIALRNRHYERPAAKRAMAVIE
jgi:glutathione S-transferase